jgi:hypothetical protein
MKFPLPGLKPLPVLLAAGLLFASAAPPARADVANAADKAYQMGMKYSAMGYYLTPTHEGFGGFGITYEFDLPVSRGLDYVFIAAGDYNCEALEIWIEAEQTGNTLAKDTRLIRNGLAGVRWRSDYNGTVNVVVHFARVLGRCGWCGIVGRRGTVAIPDQNAVSTPAGAPQPAGTDTEGRRP